MIPYPFSNTSYFSILFQEKFFQIPASEILTNNFLQQKMQMTMNKLCPPGRKLGQLAIVLKGEMGGERVFESAIAYTKSLNSTYTWAKLRMEKCRSL